MPLRSSTILSPLPGCPSITACTCPLALLPGPCGDCRLWLEGSCSRCCGARRGRWCPAGEVLPAHIWARAGSLESVSQGLGPVSSCSVCACLQGHPSWRWSRCFPGLHVATAHQDPNNGFIRAERFSLCCCCFGHHPLSWGWWWRGASGAQVGPFPRPPSPRGGHITRWEPVLDRPRAQSPLPPWLHQLPCSKGPVGRAGAAGPWAG